MIVFSQTSRSHCTADTRFKQSQMSTSLWIQKRLVLQLIAILASVGRFRTYPRVPCTWNMFRAWFHKLGLDSMAATLPYTYFQCPCSSDLPTSIQNEGDAVRAGEQAEVEDERNFDPRAPRSSYSLYPLEHLLYCEDCQQIRCPRCVWDEIVTWYCPNCLFEVPSSTVKTEGNR